MQNDKSTTGATEVKQMLEEKIVKQGNLSPQQIAILQRFEDSPYTWLSYAPVGLPYYPNGAPDFREDQVDDLNELVLMGLLISRDTMWGSEWSITDAGRAVIMANKNATKSALAAKLDQKIEKQVEKFVDPEEWDYLVRMQRGAGISVENPNGPFAYNLAVAQRLLQKGLIKLDGPSEFDPSGVSMVYSLTDAGIAVLMANNKATK